MDGLNAVGLVFGVVIGILSGAATFFNKQRFEGQIALLQAGNDELRAQVTDLRTERTDIKADLAACQARAEERERVLQDYKAQNFSLPLARLTTITNNNHKEIMTALALRLPNGK